MPDPTYTTALAVRDYLGMSTADLPDEVVDPIIIRAERDIDMAVGPFPIDPQTGRKFPVTQLNPVEVRGLADAVAAQVEYRATVGDDFMVKEQYASQGGPGYQTTGLVAKVCGAAYSSLSSAGLLHLNGRALRRRYYGDGRRWATDRFLNGLPNDV